MHKKIAALGFSFPDGEAPEWYIGPEESLALIPGLLERFEDLASCFVTGSVHAIKIRELEAFSRDFFDAWLISKEVVLGIIGEEKVWEILEFLATNRGFTWEQDAYEYFAELPKYVKIFRGGAGPMNELVEGITWMLSINTAAQLADQSDGGIVVEAEINKNDILLVSLFDLDVVPRKKSPIKPKIIIRPKLGHHEP